MEKFARIVVGYHGCRSAFARDLLLGKRSVVEWQPSRNEFDWLGAGIYFWEHSPRRALRWAHERYGNTADVVGAVIQLGACFDLMDETFTDFLAASFADVSACYAAAQLELPLNRGKESKLRELDCAVINNCLDFRDKQVQFDTVRGAFLEGSPIYEGTTISAETHIQIAVRNSDCIF
jgi:hypothetical protein